MSFFLAADLVNLFLSLFESAVIWKKKLVRIFGRRPSQRFFVELNLLVSKLDSEFQTSRNAFVLALKLHFRRFDSMNSEAVILHPIAENQLGSLNPDQIKSGLQIYDLNTHISTFWLWVYPLNLPLFDHNLIITHKSNYYNLL